MRKIGIVAHGAEGAALCFITACREGQQRLGAHMHSEIIMDSTPLARYAVAAAVSGEPLRASDGWLTVLRKLFMTIMVMALIAGCASDKRTTDDSDTTHTTAADTTVPGTQAPSTPAANHLTPDGWGPLRIGMSRAEVVAAAGDDANPNAVGGPEPGQCDEFRPARAPEGLLVMLESDTLTRISVSDNRSITTPNGLHVGDSAVTVLRAYGARAEVTPHKYVEAPARYITVWENSQPGQPRRGIRFEVDASEMVQLIHAGSESIQYVEGCL